MDSNPPENIRGHPFPGNGTHKKLLHCWWGYQSVKLLKEDNLVISIKILNVHFTFRNTFMLAHMQNKVFTDIMSFPRCIFK